MDDDEKSIRLDERQIRVLAHPLRARIPGLLRTNGPATATDLARMLDTNSGATSYHLRQLAHVGLVIDTGEGQGRRREWRATSDSHSWAPSDFDDRPDASAAATWLQVRAATIAPGTDAGPRGRVSAGRSRGGSRARRS